MSNKFHFVDLFAGCGGLSLGLEESGFSPIFVNELNNDALQSYLQNRINDFPLLKKNNCNDIKDLLINDGENLKKLIINFKKDYKINIDNGDLDLLVGGPPCQGYSGIGHRRSYSVDKKQLPSNHLYQDMAWVIKNLQPKIFLFENVRGLLNSKWTSDGTKGEIFEDVLKTFHGLKSYKIEHHLVFAKDYGTPQNRPRVLIVGVRNDIDLSNWLEDSSNVANGFLPKPTFNPPDLKDLLGDLVDPRFTYGGTNSKYRTAPKNIIQEELRTLPDGKIMGKGFSLTEQEYSKHSPIVITRFIHMLENNGSIPANLKTKKFAQRLLPAKWGEKGPTITATSLPDDYVHFSQPRTLTVREWARLQGFPDWYIFSGKRTTGGIRRAGNPKEGIFDRELPKYTQIGNAVPVYLAKKLGEHFKKIL